MELDQLRHFVKVAELGNFTKAAELNMISQSALSRSIAKLETEVGQPLFERQTRHVSLTDAGNLLLNKARQIIALVDDAREEITDDGESGQVRVGAIPTIAPYYLPEVLRRFQSLYPKGRILVQEDTTDVLVKKLSDGLVDIVIAADPIEAKYLKSHRLFEEELFLVMAADHPLKEKKQIRPSDIESLPFVLLGEAHCLSESIVSFCRQKAFQPVLVERTSQLVMVQELVALNHGISLVPAMARILDHSKRRIYRSLSGTKPTRTVVMVTNPYRFESKLQRNVQKMLTSS